MRSKLSHGKVVLLQRGPVSSWPRPSGDGFGCTNEPAVYATGPDAVVNVPLEGVEAKLTTLNTPSRMAKQKSAQATAARKRKRAERELVVFCIGVGRFHDGKVTLLFVRDVKTGCVSEENV